MNRIRARRMSLLRVPVLVLAALVPALLLVAAGGCAKKSGGGGTTCTAPFEDRNGVCRCPAGFLQGNRCVGHTAAECVVAAECDTGTGDGDTEEDGDACEGPDCDTTTDTENDVVTSVPCANLTDLTLGGDFRTFSMTDGGGNGIAQDQICRRVIDANASPPVTELMPQLPGPERVFRVSTGGLTFPDIDVIVEPAGTTPGDRLSNIGIYVYQGSAALDRMGCGMAGQCTLSGTFDVGPTGTAVTARIKGAVADSTYFVVVDGASNPPAQPNFKIRVQAVPEVTELDGDGSEQTDVEEIEEDADEEIEPEEGPLDLPVYTLELDRSFHFDYDLARDGEPVDLHWALQDADARPTVATKHAYWIALNRLYTCDSFDNALFDAEFTQSRTEFSSCSVFAFGGVALRGGTTTPVLAINAACDGTSERSISGLPNGNRAYPPALASATGLAHRAGVNVVAGAAGVFVERQGVGGWYRLALPTEVLGADTVRGASMASFTGGSTVEVMVLIDGSAGTTSRLVFAKLPASDPPGDEITPELTRIVQLPEHVVGVSYSEKDFHLWGLRGAPGADGNLLVRFKCFHSDFETGRCVPVVCR